MPTASTADALAAPGTFSTELTMLEKNRLRSANPALIVLTHPQLDSWHKLAITAAVENYGIGVVFVPLCGEVEESQEELPILQSLDPTKMTNFPLSVSASNAEPKASAPETKQTKLFINSNANINNQIDKIITEVKELVIYLLIKLIMLFL
jgi:hypothetical protein